MECEHCGREMVVIREVEVYPGLTVAVYSCPHCNQDESEF